MSTSLGKNSLITLVGQGAKTLFQGLAFIFVARALGAEHFGIFVSIAALCSILSPFVDFGGYHLIVKRISREDKIDSVLADTLGVLVSSAPFFVFLLCLLSFGIYGYPLILAIFVGVTTLFFDKFLSVFIAFQISRDSFKIVASLEIFSSAVRFLFSVLLYFMQGDVFSWVILLFIQGLITALVITYLIKRELTRIPLAWPSFKLVKMGMPFVWNQVGGNANQDFDKVCLSTISGAEIAGVYGAVMRVLNIALIPIYAFYMTAYSRYFRAAHKGQDGFKHALSMLVPSVSTGIFISLILFFLAPYIPLVLGEEYQQAVELIRLAVLIPILQTLANPFADTLSGYNKQKLRVYLLFTMLAINVVLNLLLIPDYAAQGALIATLCSHFVFFILCAWFTYKTTKITGTN